MELCLIAGCSKCSGRDKDISFFHVPKVNTRKEHRIEKLSRRCRRLHSSYLEF